MNSEQIYLSLELYKKSIGLYYAIGIIQLRGGFRISEVLKMSAKNIINETDLYIQADKNSRSKRIHVPELKRELTKWKLNHMQPFKDISRFQVYRMYKRLGITVSNNGKKYDSVTHAMRKNYIKDSYKSSGNMEITKDIAGHKSSKSTEYYVKE